MSLFRELPASAYGGGAGSQSNYLLNGKIATTITGAVATNELVTLHEGGTFRRTNPTLPWSVINNVEIGPKALPTSLLTATGSVSAPKRLLNGSFVVYYNGNLGIFTAAGNLMGVVASGLTATYRPNIIPLQNGNFVVVGITSSTLAFRVFGPTGAPITSLTTVSSAVKVSGGTSWCAEALISTNGNFILFWADSATSQVKGQIYTPAGATVGSLLSIAIDFGDRMTAAPCANGDVLLLCWNNTTSRYDIYRVTSAGAAVWGPITPSASSSPFAYPSGASAAFTLDLPPHNRLFETSSGYIALVLPNPSTGNPDIYVLDSTGTTQQRIVLPVGTTSALVPVPILKTPSGFGVAYGIGTGTNTYVSFFDPNGFGISQNILLDTGGHVGNTSNSNQYGVLYYTTWAGTGMAISRFAHDGITQEGRMLLCDGNGDLIGSAINFQGGNIQNNVAMSAPLPSSQDDGLLMIAYYAFGNVVINPFKCARSSLWGYAQAGAADQGAVTLLAAGDVVIPSSQQFGAGAAFDNRGAAVHGCQGVVGNGVAHLFGLV